jgi:hypothetical protein
MIKTNKNRISNIHKTLMLSIIVLMMFSCGNQLREEENVIISLKMKLNNNELLLNDDFFYQEYDLRNILYPDTLFKKLIHLESHNHDVQEFIIELKNIVITDSTFFSDISSFNMIFDIAVNHIQYNPNDTISHSAKEYVNIFGHCILSNLTEAITYNINNGNISESSTETIIFFDNLEKFGYIPNFEVPEKTKLWRYMQQGEWGYIFKRIGSKTKSWF